MKMRIYRYEKPDGGGPFCTFDGHLRSDPNIKFDDDLLSGCLSVKELKEWFAIRNIDVSDCVIKHYDINKADVKTTSTHILFPKNWR